MVRRHIFLLLALFVAGLALVSAQDMAKIQQIQKEMGQLSQEIKAKGGAATPEQMARLQQLQKDLFAAMGPYAGIAQQSFDQAMTPEGKAAQEKLKKQVEQQQQAMEQQQQAREKAEREGAEKAKYPGKIRSWPAAQIFQNAGFPNFTKPDGSSIVSYSTGSDDAYPHVSIWITDANPGTLQNIKRQVEDALGLMEAVKEVPNYFIIGGYLEVNLRLSGSTLTFELAQYQ